MERTQNDTVINDTATVNDNVHIDDLPVEGQQPEGGQNLEAGQTTTTQDQGQQQATPPDGQQGSPAWWKPNLFSLKYRGSTVSPRDYNHAVQLMQKGWSYESAMAEVKREKQAIEQARQEQEGNKKRWEQYERLEDAFRQNPAFATRIQQLYNESMGQAQQPQQPQQGQPQMVDPRFNELLQTVQDMRQWRGEMENQQADMAIANEIDDLRSKMSNVQWDATTESGHTLIHDVLVHARDGRFPTLIAAARDYLFETLQNNARMAGAQQVADSRQRQVRAGVVGTGASKPAAAAPADLRNKDYDDLTELALKDLGIKT